ncbi:MAG: GNAT family N-acetyltransferase [Acidaminobacteraceae bacterium]
MIKLETERLILVPLDANDLASSIEDYSKMESDLGLKVTDTILDDEMKSEAEVMLKKVIDDSENYLWLTNWAVVLKKENKIIGNIVINGYPNQSGEVIVEYGINEDYRNKGYASESLKELINWIFRNLKSTGVVVDTKKENIAAHKVLENVGAIKYKETEELICWKIEKRKA